MATAGGNRAITEDGATYNKLRRPDDFDPSITAVQRDDAVPALVPTEPAKRTLGDTDFGDEGEDGENKRLRLEDAPVRANGPNKLYEVHGRKRVRRSLNTETGMHSMFPGMLDEGEISDEDTAEALSYLRSVRYEANSMPSFFVAAPPEPKDGEPDPAIYSSGRGDSRALFEGGAWIARGDHDMRDSFDNSSVYSEDLDAQGQYYKALLLRYDLLRNKLEHAAQVSGTSVPDGAEDMATEVPQNRHEWLYTLDREFPTPTLIAQMSESEIFRGIKYCAQSLDRFSHVTRPKSCWIWSLLAKSPDGRSLDYVRVGNIRELGHKAGQLSMRLRHGMNNDSAKSGSEDAEDWEADGDAIDGCSDEDSSSDEQKLGDEKPTPTANREETNNVQDIGKDSDEESGSMSISEEEGETKEDAQVALEKAKARLLAQLGDRLVQKQPDSTPRGETDPGRPLGSDRNAHSRNSSSPSSKSPPQPTPRGKRHRHNGQVCHDPKCRKIRRPPKKQRDAERRQLAQQQPLNMPKPRILPTRAEAEAQRQQIREQEIAANQEYSTAPTGTLSQQDGKEVLHEGIAVGLTEMETEIKIPEVNMPDLNTKATIDMIITVVAECYGQKDLLRYREFWS